MLTEPVYLRTAATAQSVEHTTLAPVVDVQAPLSVRKYNRSHHVSNHVGHLDGVCTYGLLVAKSQSPGETRYQFPVIKSLYF